MCEFLPLPNKSLGFWESEIAAKGRKRYVSHGKVKNKSLGKKLESILFIQMLPKSRFTEMKFLEMNAQEIAFFTTLGCFTHT